MDVLQKLKEKRYVIATLTDLPNTMPDEVFKRDIPELLFVGDEEKDRKTALNAKCKFVRIQRDYFTDNN